MKYTILINQKAVVDAGLHRSTDFSDWAIVDYLVAWMSSPKAERMGDYVWINLKHLAKEMPLLSINSKQGISKRLMKLRDLGLIDTKQTDEGRLFCKSSLALENIIAFQTVNQSGQVSTQDDGVSTEVYGDPSTVVDIQHTIISKHTIRNITDFDDFWEIYPKRQSKKDAERAWKKVKPACYQLIAVNIANRLDAGEWTIEDKQYIPNASTYLNQERWNDEVIQNAKRQTTATDRRQQIADATYGADALNF